MVAIFTQDDKRPGSHGPPGIPMSRGGVHSKKLTCNGAGISRSFCWQSYIEKKKRTKTAFLAEPLAGPTFPLFFWLQALHAFITKNLTNLSFSGQTKTHFQECTDQRLTRSFWRPSGTLAWVPQTLGNPFKIHNKLWNILSVGDYLVDLKPVVGVHIPTFAKALVFTGFHWFSYGYLPDFCSFDT